MADLIRSRREKAFQTKFSTYDVKLATPDLSPLDRMVDSIFNTMSKKKEIENRTALAEKEMDLNFSLDKQRLDNNLAISKAQDAAQLASTKYRVAAGEQTDRARVDADMAAKEAEVRAREQAQIDASNVKVGLTPDGKAIPLPTPGGGLVYQQVFKEVVGERYLLDFESRLSRRLGEIQVEPGTAAERFAKMQAATAGALEGVPELFKFSAEKFLVGQLDQRSNTMLVQEGEQNRLNSIEEAKLHTETLANRLSDDVALGRPIAETDASLKKTLAARVALHDISEGSAKLIYEQTMAQLPAMGMLRKITQDANQDATTLDSDSLKRFNFAVANGDGNATLTLTDGTVVKAADIITSLQSPEARTSYANSLQEMGTMLAQRESAAEEGLSLSSDLAAARSNPRHTISSKSEATLDKMAQGADIRNPATMQEVIELATTAKYIPKPIRQQLEQMMVNVSSMGEFANLWHQLSNLKGPDGADVGLTLKFDDGMKNMAALVTTGVQYGLEPSEIRQAMLNARNTPVQQTITDFNKARADGTPSFENAVTTMLAEAEGVDPSFISRGLLTQAQQVYHMLAQVAPTKEAALERTVQQMQERLVFSEAFRGGWALNSGRDMMNPENPNAGFWEKIGWGKSNTAATLGSGYGGVSQQQGENAYSMAEGFIFEEVKPLLAKMDEMDRKAVEDLIAAQGKGQLLGKKMWLQPTNTDTGSQQFELWVSTGDDTKYSMGQPVWINDEKGLRPLVIDPGMKLKAADAANRSLYQSSQIEEGHEKQVTEAFMRAGYSPFGGLGAAKGPTREEFVAALPEGRRKALEREVEVLGLRRNKALREVRGQ